jgi:recombination protein RecA
VRIEVRKSESLKVGGEIIGNRTKAKVVKNKVAPPFKVAEFDILYGTGISRTGELIDMGVELDVVSKMGAWFSFDEARMGQGKENAREFLVKNPDIADEIERRIRAKIEGDSEAAAQVTKGAASESSEDTGGDESSAPTAGRGGKGLDVSAEDFE